MSIQFDKIGQTVAVGAIFTLYIAILLRHRIAIRNMFAELKALKVPELLVVAILLAFMYVIGIFSQGISKKVVAERPMPIGWLVPNFILPTDKDMRARHFDFWRNNKLNSVDVQKLDSFLSQGFGSKDSPDTGNFFTKCKNQVFFKEGYKEELREYENELFFATSFTFIVWAMFCFYIFFSIYVLIKYGWESLIGEKFYYEKYALLVLFFLIFIGSVGYQSLQEAFNLRIYGYGFSDLICK